MKYIIFLWLLTLPLIDNIIAFYDPKHGSDFMC